MKKVKGVVDVTQGAGYVPVNFYDSIGEEDTNKIQVELTTKDVFGDDLAANPKVIDLYLTTDAGALEGIVSASGVTDFGVMSASACTELNTDLATSANAVLNVFMPAGEDTVGVEITCDAAETKNLWVKANDLVSSNDITFTT